MPRIVKAGARESDGFGIRRTLIVGLLLLLPGWSLLAAQLTLDQAMQEVLANSKELQAKRLAVKIAESELLKAQLWSPTNPELEVEGVSDVLTGNSGDGRVQIGVAQDVELGGQRRYRIEIVNARIESARLKVSIVERALERDVRAAFYSLLLAQQRKSFSLNADSLATALRDTASIRVKAGSMQVSEFTNLDLDLASSRAVNYQSQAALDQARGDLLRLLGRSPDDSLKAVGEVGFQRLTVSEDSVISLAVLNRQELQENRLQQAETQAELGLAGSEQTPNVKASLFYAQERSVFSSGDIIGNNVGVRGIKDVNHLIGIRFSIPLPLIDKRQSEIARFQSEADVNRAAGEGLENQVRHESRNAYKVLISAQNVLELLMQVQPEADSLFHKFQTAYLGGRVSLTDYLTQKERLLNMPLRLLDAYKAYVAAQVELERAVGLEWNQIERGEE